MSKNNKSSSVRILHKIYFLRNITIVFILTMAMAGFFILKINLPITPLGVITLLMVVANVVTRFFINRVNEVTDSIIFAQLLVDVALFSFILFFTGGATNPVTFFYLIPLAVSATIIPGLMTWFLMLLTVVFYSLLLEYYIPLSYQTPVANEHFSQHVLGMWVGFLMSAVLVTWFITYLAKELRQHKQNLADAKQREIVDQQIVTMGALAAGTAHELGTPLASLAIVAGEITNGLEAGKYPELFENQKILLKQIKRCKKTISVLSDSTGNSRADAGHLMPVDDFFKLILEKWLYQRPDAAYKIEHKKQKIIAKILYDETISQALINLLNNASDESTKPIEIYINIKAQEVVIEILDNGDGITNEQIALAGKEFFSEKPNGIGIGLFLAITTIRRSGGSVDFKRKKPSGTSTMVKLPLIKAGYE